jgi:hypothetical protein
LAVRSAVVLVLVTLASCGGGPNAPKAYPVKGKILVNGQPANECEITLNRISGPELPTPVTPSGLTDQNGEYQLTSYYGGDGAPDGEYVITVVWRERTGLAKTEFGGPDKLGGAYGKAEKNKYLPGFVVKVEGKPLELPPLQLTQSAEAKRRAEEAKKRGGLGFDR